MTTIFDEMTTVPGEVVDSSYEPVPSPEAGGPPFKPPVDKTYGGDDDSEGGDETPPGAVSLSPRQIYAGLKTLFDALDVKGFEGVNKQAAVGVFVGGYNKYNEADYDETFWEDLE